MSEPVFNFESIEKSSNKPLMPTEKVSGIDNNNNFESKSKNADTADSATNSGEKKYPSNGKDIKFKINKSPYCSPPSSPDPNRRKQFPVEFIDKKKYDDVIHHYIKGIRYVRFVFDKEDDWEGNMCFRSYGMSGMATGPVGEPVSNLNFKNSTNETKLTVTYETDIMKHDKSYNNWILENENVDIKFGKDDCTNVEYVKRSGYDCVFITFFYTKIEGP
jgi:hypothetical protein